MVLEGWLLLGLGLALIAGVAYWQLVIAEGAFLGQRVVTWLYDITAHRYDSIKGFDAEMEALFLGHPLAEALEGEVSPLVLDIGTGTGRLPLALLTQPKFQGRVIGVDDSRRMLKFARDKTHGIEDRLWLVWTAGACLPFIDAAFDTVTCLEMLEFTPNPIDQLREAVRVLRPGGVLLTTRRRGVDARLMPGKTFSTSEFAAILERLGLFNIDIQAWQVDYDLVWATRDGIPERGYGHPLEALRCSRCGNTALTEQESALICGECGASHPVRSGIILMKR